MGLATVVLLTATFGVANASAGAPVAKVLGVSPIPGVSDGRSTIALGTGSDLRLFHDGEKTPTTGALPAGCGVQLAAAGTGLAQCSGATSLDVVGAPQLVSMRTGTARSLPGADRLPATDTTTFAMGANWIAATQCPSKCSQVALQWHTGVLRAFRYNRKQSPQVALDSATLTPSDRPSINTTGKAWVYRRGAFSRSIESYAADITTVQIVGWRAAWLTRDTRAPGTNYRQVNVLNAKTGRLTSIPLRRFGARAISLPIDSRYRLKLQATREHLVLSFVTDSNPTNYTVATLPWSV